jgi:hypothetical protein
VKSTFQRFQIEYRTSRFLKLGVSASDQSRGGNGDEDLESITAETFMRDESVITPST